MYPLLAKDGLVVAYVAVLYFAWLPLAIQLPPRPTSLASSLFTVPFPTRNTTHTHTHTTHDTRWHTRNI